MKMQICWFHNSDDHDINQCTAFGFQDKKIKVDLIKKKRLKSFHIACNFVERKPGLTTSHGKTTCTKYRHQTLHLDVVKGLTFHSTGVGCKSWNSSY